MPLTKEAPFFWEGYSRLWDWLKQANHHFIISLFNFPPILLAPLSVGFPRQEYWRVLPFPRSGDLPNPRIEVLSSVSIGSWILYHWATYLPIKKNEIMPFAATRMELEMNILGEVSQTEKDKYYFTSLICGIYNMTQRNLSTKSNSLINREQTCGC